MRIDRDYILNFIKRIKEEEIIKEDKKTFYSKNNLALNIIKKAINKKIKKFIAGGLKELKNKDFITSEGDLRYWSMDFLIYSLENNVSFNTSLFEKKDEKEILKFVNNKIRLAVLSKIKKDFLFEKEDLTGEEEYERLKKNLIKNKEAINFNGKDYYYNTNHIEINSFYHWYGLKELPKDIIKSLEEKTFVDAGAFWGDSLIIFKQFSPKEVICFEPSEESFKELEKCVKKNNFKNVKLIKKGVGEKEEKKFFQKRGSCSKILEKEDKTFIEIQTIDSLNKPIDLIKMDIEGYELNAVKGAEKTIKKYKPVLLVCLYHRGQDFFEIPKLIKEWVPEYKLRFLNINKIHPIFERVMLAYI